MRNNNQFRAERPSQLLRAQSSALRAILLSVARIARDAALGTHPGATEFQRPHHVFCIDGGRGSGKTYTLLSLAHALDQISQWQVHPAETNEEWSAFFNKLDNDDLTALRGPARTVRPLAHVLRLIFPGDMEGGDSLMESIFAAMMADLGEDDGSSMDNSEPRQPARGREKNLELRQVAKDKEKSLRTTLRTKVAEGWYFARRFGIDAIIRDSIDYEDLVARFETESRKASGRISAWRDFVTEYLDSRPADALVIMLDDSDVKPELTHDILHSIRMFLNHPRIITVIAGNLKSMRHCLLQLAMRQIATAMAALGPKDRRTAQDWRRVERKAVEEYLEKVLPPAQRYYLRQSDRKSDFVKITDKELPQVCKERLELTRRAFLTAKFDLAVELEIGNSDVPTDREAPGLEDFLSWWIFDTRYSSPLSPRSARQIATFRDFYIPGHRPAKAARAKRLAVTLFETPDNYTLNQRFADEDVNVTAWLRQQDLGSVWIGRRMFRINGREAYQGSYTYDFIRFRLDVGFAMPIRDNAEEAVPVQLLPRLRGRQYMRRFFQPSYMPRQQRRLGVSRWINHAAIPGNCIYFHDLGALPDVSLAPDSSRYLAPGNGHWEAELSGKWVELLEERQDEQLVRYFVEIVCARLRNTEQIPSASLMLWLDPSDTHAKAEHGLYEHFLDREIGSFREFKSAPEHWSMAIATPAGTPAGHAPVDPEQQKVEAARWMIPRYAALVTDLRRAWHAVRLHENYPELAEPSTEAGKAREHEHERTSRAVIYNQSRMLLFTRETLQRTLNKSGWVRNVVAIFQTRAFRDRVKGLPAGSPDPFFPGTIDKLFTLAGGINGQPIEAERTDFCDWTQCLRSAGRATCKGWRVHDGDNSLAQYGLESELFVRGVLLDLKRWRLHIFDADIGDIDVERHRRNWDQQRENWRAACRFVWLLYGLAPSLPAIIHANVMAVVYDIEGRVDAASRTEAGDDYLKLIVTEAGDDYRKVIVELEEWGELIGALSMAIRYVKIKCLHSFASQFIEAMLRDIGNDAGGLPPVVGRSNDGAAAGRHSSLPGARVQFLDKCGLEADEKLGALAFQKLGQEFWQHASTKQGEESWRRASAALPIMPDVSPSTLLGDGWMIDLVNTNGMKAPLLALGVRAKSDAPTPAPATKDGESGAPAGSEIELELVDRARRAAKPVDRDDPLRVTGIFGETEQWFWAANRCLRKLKETIEGRAQ